MQLGELALLSITPGNNLYAALNFSFLIQDFIVVNVTFVLDIIQIIINTSDERNCNCSITFESITLYSGLSLGNFA